MNQSTACRILRHAALLLVLPALTVASVSPASGVVTGPVTESPGTVTTTVHDAATGRPARACVRLVPLDRDRYTWVSLGERQLGMAGGCTDEQGAIVADGVEPGRYQLFAAPRDRQHHGQQWVGARGGTGQRHLAAVVAVRAGATAAAPQIRLDPPGDITGTLTGAATGQPVQGVYIGVVPMVPHPKYTPEPISDPAGRYTVTGLGPYRWALQFFGPRTATQWSGGVGNAMLARTVQVRSGQTVTLDQVLRAPTMVVGTVLVDELPSYSPVIAFNAVTGDVTGVEYVGNTYQLPVLPGQVIKLRCDCSYRSIQWHPAAQTFTEAALVWVGWTPVTIDFDLTATS
ncbi:carboxypeptidase-like regulatory domain-containing protein [Micromonospora sp. LOL_023]|uniref:carboxypeptidase-like regulatory domain-containing protein n=1 Tax=Micromonospora sp. LOL_023 TaxID=3345418 RepID=UPI003A8BF32D